jgi:hypothetical protein
VTSGAVPSSRCRRPPGVRRGSLLLHGLVALSRLRRVRRGGDRRRRTRHWQRYRADRGRTRNTVAIRLLAAQLLRKRPNCRDLADVVSALSTVDTRLETLLARSTAMALPEGPSRPSSRPRRSPRSRRRTPGPRQQHLVAGSFWPSAGAVSGVTITASVARSVTAAADREVAGLRVRLRAGSCASDGGEARWSRPPSSWPGSRCRSAARPAAGRRSARWWAWPAVCVGRRQVLS